MEVLIKGVKGLEYKIEHIGKEFSNLKVLEDISFTIPKGYVTCILGPSGCGKSTLLNIINGTIKDYEGEVKGLQKEKISFVFQEPRLIKWNTLWDNIDFVLKDKLDIKARKNIIQHYLNQVDMLDFKDYYPDFISGGMQQKVSIARAFAYSSEVLLMDEPFKSLDIASKENIINTLANIIDKEKRTSILVTHDLEEAALLGDYIVIFTNKPTKVKKILENPIKSVSARRKEKFIMEDFAKEIKSYLLGGE